MYIPSSFGIKDPATLHAFIGRYGFATLVTGGAAGEVPVITHLPMLLDPDRGPMGTLIGHVAQGESALAGGSFSQPQHRHFSWAPCVYLARVVSEPGPRGADVELCGCPRDGPAIADSRAGTDPGSRAGVVEAIRAGAGSAE